VRIGIVAHDARLDEAWRLFNRTGADFISIDNGNIGPRANHLRVWDRLVQMSEEGEWLVALEDDAVLCPKFMSNLYNVLRTAPTHLSVISLYMGRLNPRQWQDRLRQAVAQADSSNACWITSRMCLHAVGVCIPHEHAADFLHHVRTLHGPARPIDETISAWCRSTKRTVGYCYPSIVNHADGDTLINHPDKVQRQKGRVAWRFGGREQWTSVTLALDPNER
jgi:hypothetical protein